VIAALLKLLGSWGFSLGADGQLIPLYPHPLEVVFITVVTTLFVLWLFQWYRRDRVQHMFKILDYEERRQMLALLANDLEADAERLLSVASKRKCGQTNWDMQQFASDEEQHHQRDYVDSKRERAYQAEQSLQN